MFCAFSRLKGRTSRRKL